MKRANSIRGRIEEHAKGLGTPNEQMVRERAREVALTNGRKADEFNEADLEQARLELEGAQNAPPETLDVDAEELVVRDGPSTSRGRAARTKLATDEQVVPEQLVAEGVEEAAHDEMRDGNAESRRRDKRFEDQLPSS